MQISKYILLFIACYFAPILSKAQVVSGFQGKRGVVEVGLSPLLTTVGIGASGIQGSLFTSYAINKSTNIGLQLDRTITTLFTERVFTTVGISYQVRATKYSIAPYGRFWTFNIGRHSIGNITENAADKVTGLYSSLGFFDRSIWRPISLSWGSEIGISNLTPNNPNMNMWENEGIGIFVRMFLRVGLVW